MRGIALGFLVVWAAFAVSACDLGGGGPDAGRVSEADVAASGDTGPVANLQDVPLTPANLFFVQQSVQTMSPAVDMKFAAPPELGATRYTLQSSDDDRASWQNFDYGGGLLTTDAFEDPAQANNFSIDIVQDRWLRLLIEGGPYDGETSNEMWAKLYTTAAYVSNWSLDESEHISGVIGPQAGYGLEAAFVIKDYPAGAVVEDALAFQWYRVNPAAYEETTAVDGATELTYITSAADRGYRMMIRADGTGEGFDGFCSILSSWVVE